MRKELLAVGGSEYDWLQDFILRVVTGELAVPDDDYDRVVRLGQRMACCTRCEDIWNDAVLEDAGYVKNGESNE